jgi:hypothetical protein
MAFPRLGLHRLSYIQNEAALHSLFSLMKIFARTALNTYALKGAGRPVAMSGDWVALTGLQWERL